MKERKKRFIHFLKNSVVLHTIPLLVQSRLVYYQIIVYIYQPHQPLPKTKTRHGNGSRSHAHIATAGKLHRDATHAPHGDDDAHDILLGEDVVKHFKDYQILYQPKTRNLMLNKKENMSIRLENVDKPESIVDLEQIWFF